MINDLIIEEITLENSGDEWNKFISESINPNMYQYDEFIKINSYKCRVVKNLVFKEKNKIVASISFGIFENNIIKSPFSSSFAGFNYLKNIQLTKLNIIIKRFIEYCSNNGFRRIEICEPPLIYFKEMDEKIDYALLSNSFILKRYDVSFYKRKENWKENLKSNLKRNVKKAITYGLKFEKIDNIKECFDFISKNKEKQKIPFSINYRDFELLMEKYSQHIYLFGVYKNEILISSIIMYSINSRTILGFNWAQDK